MNKYCNIFISMLLLSGCCSSIDTRAPSGYPFNGTSQELVFSIYRNPGQIAIKSLDSLRNFVRDSLQFQEVFGRQPDIDLRKHSLVRVFDGAWNVASAEFQQRVIIDHSLKTYTVELRSFKRWCSGGIFSPGADAHFEFSEFLLIPGIPNGYSYSIINY